MLTVHWEVTSYIGVWFDWVLARSPVVVTPFQPSWRAPCELSVCVSPSLSLNTSNGQWDSCVAAAEFLCSKSLYVVLNTQLQTSAVEEVLQQPCSTAEAANFDKWFRSQTRFPKLVREDVKDEDQSR